MVTQARIAAAQREMEEAALELEQLAVELSRIPRRGHEVYLTVRDAIARIRTLADAIERADLIVGPIHAATKASIKSDT